MTKAVKARLIVICLVILSIGVGIALLLHAMSDSIIFFYSPSQLHKANLTQEIRVGGIVKPGSIIKLDHSTIAFCITDFDKDLDVHYKGLIPTLFREDQAIVAKGKLYNNIFIATELLAKHDENYMPYDEFIKWSHKTSSEQR